MHMIIRKILLFQISVKASLFTLMNEDGKLIDFKICPTDEFQHVGELLKAIWYAQKENGTFTTQYHTDNVAKDKSELQALLINSTMLLLL